MSASDVLAGQRFPSVRFAVLGPLGVMYGENEIRVSSPAHQVLLAMLLLHANRPVSAELLTEAVWDAVPPVTAQASLQNHVMRLRRALGPVGARLLTRAPGYLMRVADGELDLDRFARLQEAGLIAARGGDWPGAEHTLRSALCEWTGEPLSGIRASMPLAAQAQCLAEQRLRTVELRLEAGLYDGRSADAVAELRSLTALHPLRESFRELLMTALYADGRQAEALAVYRDFRETLVKEHGIDPGHRLQRLHQRVLAADPELAAAPPDRVPPRGEGLMGRRAGGRPPESRPWPGGPLPAPHPLLVPRQLPPPVGSLVGRDTELCQLGSWLRRPELPLIAAICGTAGVGKTALAVHWAHQVADLFPGGQLYLDLRGFGPAGTPTDPAEAIRCLLDGLGVPASQVPPSGPAQVSLYRTLLADRERTLIVLDNARDAGQVRPLLPGTASCHTIVTSRDELAGLAAVDGAEVLALDVLTDSEAQQLLVNRIGTDLAARDRAAIGQLSVLCARLPLALAVAAARIALPSGPAPAWLVGELRDARGRLDALDTGDQASSVRAVFSWSYRCLTRPAARLFRLLGLHNGPDIGISGAASLAGVPVEQVRRMLAELTRAQLLIRRAPGRFCCHDLLRAYADERATAEESERARRAALCRLLDYYLHTGAAAQRRLSPAGDRLTLAPAVEGVTTERPTEPEQAIAWFEDEYQSLLGAVALADAAGLPGHVWQLAAVLFDFLQRTGRWSSSLRVQRTALAAAESLADAAGIAMAHRALGMAFGQVGRRAAARAHLLAARDTYRATGDPVGEGRVSLDLALLTEQDGKDPDALRYAEHALGLFVQVGHQAGQGRALNAVGWYHARMGESRRALDPCGRAVALCAELGDRIGEAAAWDSLGFCHRELGDYPAAISCTNRAVALIALTGDRYHLVNALVQCGDAHEAAGYPAAARDAWRRAVIILDDLRHPYAGYVRQRLA